MSSSEIITIEIMRTISELDSSHIQFNGRIVKAQGISELQRSRFFQKPVKIGTTGNVTLPRDLTDELARWLQARTWGTD